eukprot:CAMPEP_0183459066 /NCGR_PEP_ID=MMETSP0370-20130417/134789_1 /TAXON_ID=268820 /ORGANISM="Peridinium aciculiferum, Strain PAER-2" /LENGTH=51 /DNA_ID=CAMNT_0025650879 /DNA_START=40 /DNA_END=192 /DNA_ORIENTATION=-
MRWARSGMHRLRARAGRHRWAAAEGRGRMPPEAMPAVTCDLPAAGRMASAA